MLDVDGRSKSVSTTSTADRDVLPVEDEGSAELIGKWVTWSGLGVAALSVFGGVFPYFANGLGLSLDGAPDGAMTAWRTALHLVPGVLGLVVGLAMVNWGRRRMAGRPVGANGARFIGRATVVVGAWFAIGPYLAGIAAPGQAHGTGGHAGMMMGGNGANWLVNSMMPMPPASGHMAKMPSTVNCAFTMGVCHWLVGGLIVFGGLVALGAGLGMGPIGGLSKARSDSAKV